MDCVHSRVLDHAPLFDLVQIMFCLFNPYFLKQYSDNPQGFPIAKHPCLHGFSQKSTMFLPLRWICDTQTPPKQRLKPIRDCPWFCACLIGTETVQLRFQRQLIAPCYGTNFSALAMLVCPKIVAPAVFKSRRPLKNCLVLSWRGTPSHHPFLCRIFH